MGDGERGAPHGEVARQSHVRGVRYRLGPRESLPRCWIGGGRMHLLVEITHPTRAIGEVAAPVAVVAQPFGYGGEPGQRARLGRAVADAPVEHGGGIVGRDEFMQFGGPAKYASGSGPRAPAARDDCAGWGRRVGGEPVEELLGDLVEGGELCLAEHVVRRGPARLGSAGPRRAVGSPTRPGCGGCWWPRSAHRRAGGCRPGCPRVRGSGCRRRGGCLAASAR
jgi:hypothetical protein